MNNAPSNQTGGTNQFTQGTSQSNPFSQDLKGEFTSNFGTNTNAVSQIFKEGGFVQPNTKKYIIIGVLAVLAIGVAVWIGFMDREEDESMPGSGEENAESSPVDGEEGDEATATKKPDSMAQTQPKDMAKEAAPAVPAAEAARPMGGSVTLVSPANGSSMDYDETKGPAVFNWEGGGGVIAFSRNSSMSPETLRANVSSNSYSFNHPYPGRWYWKVNDSEVRSFTVSPPVRRNISLVQPKSGGAVAGSGGVVSWQGDSNVAYYRVEFSSNNSWANPSHRFATSNNSQLQLQGVPAGTYQMRLGGFSEVSGRWEYTAPVSVTIQ